MLNGIATNKVLMTFNPAPGNTNAYCLANELKSYSHYAVSTNYIVQGDILHSTVGQIWKPIGTVVYLPQQLAMPKINPLLALSPYLYMGNYIRNSFNPVLANHNNVADALADWRKTQ